MLGEEDAALATADPCRCVKGQRRQHTPARRVRSYIIFYLLRFLPPPYRYFNIHRAWSRVHNHNVIVSIVMIIYYIIIYYNMVDINCSARCTLLLLLLCVITAPAGRGLFTQRVCVSRRGGAWAMDLTLAMLSRLSIGEDAYPVVPI